MSFISVAFGYLKSKGVDTSKMSVEEAIDKYSELKKVDTATSFGAIGDGEDEQRIADGRKEIDKVKKKVVKLNKRDYAIICSEIVRKNANKQGKYPIDFAYTDELFVVYKNYGLNNFKVTVKLDLEKDRDKIDKIIKEIDD